MSKPPELPISSSTELMRMAELGMLSAGLVHELRQPLFAVKAFGELIRHQPRDAEHHVQRLLEQVQAIEDLLEGYADFSRKPQGDVELFDVRAPLRSALVLLERRAWAAGVQLQVQLEEVPLVRGSRLALQQAVVNLGANAVDAVRGTEGGRIDVRCLREPRGVRVEVQDNGPGISESIRSQLFHPFQTTKATGTGLGLSLSHRWLTATEAELHLRPGPGTHWQILLQAA
jgi:C4-dicarboxylate-specific signal transduction histidine kinase